MELEKFKVIQRSLVMTLFDVSYDLLVLLSNCLNTVQLSTMMTHLHISSRVNYHNMFNPFDTNHECNIRHRHMKITALTN